MERLDPWQINIDIDRVRAAQKQIDDELNHLSRIIRILRNRQQWLIEERNDNFDKYTMLKSLKTQIP